MSTACHSVMNILSDVWCLLRGRFCWRYAGALFAALMVIPCFLEASEAPPKSRPVMAGDRLRIIVLEDDTLTRAYAVAGDGTIDFGYFGRIQVDSETPEAVAIKLRNLLERSHYKKATVSVEVETFVEGSVLMTGALNNPGALDFKGDQILTLMEAIAMSGGLHPNADAKNVRILRWRPGGGLEREIITVDVKSMVDSLDFGKDQFLRPRDMVFVPLMGGSGESAEFLALGEFGKTGFHPHQPGLDMIRAVALAGGISREANMAAVRLLRPDGPGGQYRAIPVDLSRLFGSADMQMNIPVLPGDILFAPSASQASGGSIYLLGEVERPGIYPLPLQGEATLARTLLMNGGLGKYANPARVRIQRKGPDGRRESIEMDVGRMLKTGSFEDDIPLRDEDVIIVPERMLF